MQQDLHIKQIRESIDNAKLSDLKLEVVVIANGCCSECDKINGLVMPFDESDKNPPIPHSKCINPHGCNCTIGFKAVRDENGRPVKTKY